MPSTRHQPNARIAASTEPALTPLTLISRQTIRRISSVAMAACLSAGLSSAPLSVLAQTETAQRDTVTGPASDTASGDAEANAAANQASDAEDVADAGPATGSLVLGQAQTSLIRNTFIAAPMAGVVASVEVVEGQPVEIDAPLVRMESVLAEHELTAAKAAFEAAKLQSDNDVNLRFAQRTLEVREHEMDQSRLANQAYAGAVSEMELVELRLKVDQASLAIEQARHDLMIASAAAIEKEVAVSIAQTKLDRHTVRTGVAGTVTQIDAEPGECVDVGEPLFRVINVDPIRVECFVDGTHRGAELVGRAVQFIPTGATDGVRLRGQITFVSRELHPVTGQVRLWATVDNPREAIGSGVSGTLILD